MSEPYYQDDLVTTFEKILAARAAERRATVERIRAAVLSMDGQCHDGEGLGCESSPCVENIARAEVLAILDAEAV